MPAVKALLPEASATPNQVVHRALQLLDAIREVRCRRRAGGVCHARKLWLPTAAAKNGEGRWFAESVVILRLQVGFGVSVAGPDPAPIVP